MEQISEPMRLLLWHRLCRGTRLVRVNPQPCRRLDGEHIPQYLKKVQSWDHFASTITILAYKGSVSATLSVQDTRDCGESALSAAHSGGLPHTPLLDHRRISKGRRETNDVIADVISVTKVHLALEQLLGTYLRELEESRRDDDTHDMEYWESACQTIYDVAAALNISLEEQPSRRRPYKPDSMTPDNGDVQLTDGKDQKTASRAFSSGVAPGSTKENKYRDDSC